MVPGIGRIYQNHEQNLKGELKKELVGDFLIGGLCFEKGNNLNG